MIRTTRPRPKLAKPAPSLVIVTASTGDTKLSSRGRMAATWAPQMSCPRSCPLLVLPTAAQREAARITKKPCYGPCYANNGNSSLHTARLNRAAEQAHNRLMKGRP